ncbi:alginate O-acetyltransferase AlgX-related protein [Ralstonia flaminis]|jgi:alginate O-acetyltransferase complex protein AlgJ|uniref:Alginate O-acetylase AlgJ n=1 Tax=Ralstonia flaminis TaxID=3058597 RepID=A0ABN9JP99_9RALS|nr:cell division protein FtsQ [Ralstonia sp. LMG 18101]CAJ0819494.1 putative alginate O-acetylase AlgJ [Ralstonia sp. LMG 18101]
MSDGLARSSAAALPGKEPAEAVLPDRSMLWHRALAWTVAVLLAVGLGMAAVALARQADNGEPFNWAGWRDGTLGHQIESAIDVPYARTLHRWQAALRYRVLGDLGPQVREGCPGWLFYADGLRPPPAATGQVRQVGMPGADALLDARIATLRRYADALRKDGIRLVVVTVPDKARVEVQALCGLHQDARMTQRLTGWQQAVDAAGVTRVELLPALQQAAPAYFRTDVHWNADGAQAAANVISAAVLPLLGGRGEARFDHQQGAVEPRVGDLLTLAGLGDVSDAWRPAPDQVAPQTISAVHSGGLLDDAPPVEVMLAGSSFSRRSEFAGRLGEQLGREVWNVSLDDGQFDRAMQAMWDKRATWPKSVRVLVWEMSEDALHLPVKTLPNGASH